MALTTIEELNNTRNEILSGAEQIRQQRQGYADLFNEGKPLTQNEFNWLLAARQNASDPERATQQVAHAMLISHNYGVSLDDAMQNMGVYTQELLGREPEYTKSGLRTLSDRLKIGNLGIEYQELTYAFKQADLNAEKEKDPNKKKEYEAQRDDLKKQIEEKLSQMEELRKNLPDGMWNTLIGGLMENLPQQWDMFKNLAYGAAMTTAGLAVGSFVAGMPLAAPIALGSAVTLLNAGAVGLGAATGSFLRMKDLQEGAMYYELVNQGVEKDIANWASYADGLIEAGIEMGFGVTPAVGSAVFKSLGMKKIAKQAAMKAFSSGTMGRIGMFFTKLLKTGAGEGAEEGLQRAASDLTKCAVSAMSKSGYDPDVSVEKSIKEGMYEVLMGAWVGTVLGVFPVSLELHADIKYAKSLKQDAEATATKQQFVDNHKGDDAFKDMKEEDTAEFLGNVYDKNQEEASRKFDEMTQVRQKYRDKRRGMLSKEEEELNAQEDSDYKKQRLDAIAKEREHLENVEKWDAVSDAKWREDKLREKYINEQTEENRQAWEKQRGVRDELERNMGRPDEVAEYEELGSRINELDEDELKRYTDLGFNQNVQDWYERKRTYQPQEEEQDWQKSPEDIERVKSEPKNIELDTKDREDISKLTEKADFRTWVSESSRIMRKYMDKDSVTALEDHYNVKDGKWTVDADNRFADDVSKFMATGQAPVSSLKQSFKAVADSLLGVYQRNRTRVSQDINEAFRKMSSDQRSVYYGQNKYNYQTETVRAGEQPSEAFHFTNPVEFDRETVDMGGGIEQTIRSMRNYTNPDGTKPDGIIISDGADKTYVRFSNERTGNVYLDNFTTKPTQMQKDSIEMLGKVVADVTHNDVFVYESVEKDGQRVFAKDVAGHKAGTPAPNGFYDPSTSSIYIDLNAGNNGEGVMLWTASHELTHFVKQWSPEKFDELAEFLAEEYGKKGVDIKTLVQNQIDKAKAQGREMSYDEAYEEVVADSMQTMFTDTNLAEKLEKLRAKDADLWSKIKAWIIGLYNRLMDAYRNFAPQTQESKLVREMADAIDKISDMFADSIVDAGDKFKLAEYGVSIVGDTAVKTSLRTWNETDKEKLLNLLVKVGNDKKESKKWIEDVNGYASIIAANRDRYDYTSDDTQTMIKKDDEYYITIDSSTLCPKRRYYQGTFNAIMKARPNYVFTEDDILLLRNKLLENDFEAFCGFCYVESMRKRFPRFASEWLTKYAKEHKGEFIPTMYELTASDTPLRYTHPEIYDEFIKGMNKKGNQSPKVVQLRTSYKRDILKRVTPAMVTKLNHIGGIRFDSFSDLDIVNIIDMMQTIIDIATKRDKQGNRLNGQGYAKVAAFAAIFGDTNLKINLSVVASVDKKGNLVFDNVEGININEALKWRNRYSDNVGTILVGSNERQVRAAMASDIIDFIIPFHRSGWNKQQYVALGLSEYIDHQTIQHDLKVDYTELDKSRKKAGGNYYPADYWDYSVDGNTNAMTYLNMCLDDGRIPRFLNYAFERDAAEAFVKANPDIMVKIPSSSKPVKLTADILLSIEGMTSLCTTLNRGRNQRAIAYDYLKFALENGFETTDGYWKTLIDFKSYNNDGVGVPQKGLVPNFNMEEARKYLESYEGNADTLPVAESVKREFLEHIKDREDLKYSQRTYHGSGANFDRFDTAFMGTGEGYQAFGWGIYLSQSEGISRSYAEKLRKPATWVRNGKPLEGNELEVVSRLDWDRRSHMDNLSLEEQRVESIKRYKKEIEDQKQINKETQAAIDIFNKFYADDSLSNDEKVYKIREAIENTKEIPYAGVYTQYLDIFDTYLAPVLTQYKDMLERGENHLKELADYIEGAENIDTTGITAEQSKRNLYTTSIPDDTGNNYLKWDKVYSEKEADEIIERINNVSDEKWGTGDIEGRGSTYDEFRTTGEEIYHNIEELLESDKAASELLNKAGFVGIDYPANSRSGGNRHGKRNFVIFNADDITIDNHLKYSARDTEYLESVNAGDMETAQRMVDEQAKANGYDSPKLYHGTEYSFGFTKIDPKASDDGMSFFATNSLEVAETYSTVGVVTPIGKHNLDIDAIEEGKENVYKEIDKYLDFISKINPDYYKDNIHDRENLITEDDFEALGDYNFKEEVIEPVMNEADRLYYDATKGFSEEQIEKLVEQKWNLAQDIEDALNKLYTAYLLEYSTTGNYALYAKTDNFLEIDAEGANWDDITIPANTIGNDKDVEGATTREIAKLAKNLDYDGVIVRNVFDNGGRTETELEFPADVYIFFNPQAQVKSADPVTYDSQGNIIPLSERFNPEHTEDNLIYSAREQNEETYQQANEDGNYVPDIILQQYRNSEWAREEIEVRQDYKNIINSEYRVMSAEDADNDDNGFAQFVTAMKENDPHKRTTRYYEQMWEAATASKNIKYTDAFKNMSKRMLETLLQNLNKFQENGKLQETPEGIIAEAMQLFKDKEELSDEDFNRIMKDIASSDDKANTALAYLEECFSDPEDFKKMMLAITASPDVFAIREINKYVKGNEHYRNTTMRKLAEDINTLREFIRDVRNSFVSKEVMKEKLAQLKQAYKDRALFNKCLRMIFRKVSGMCAADQHDEIIAIQDKYSKTSMMDSTRENLQKAYDKETNPKRKADLKKRLEQISLKELPLAEVVAIADHVAKLRHDGLVARIAYEADVKEYRLGWIDRLIDALGKVTKLDKSGSIERRLINGKHPYSRFMSAWGDIFRISEYMGKAWVELFEQVHDAHRNEVENRYRRRKAAVDEMKRLGLKTSTLAQTEVLSNGKTYTHDALLSYYIYTKNADSYAALLYGNLEANGNDLTSMDRADAFIREAISKLSKAEKQFGDWMMKSFTGDDWKRLNFVIRNVDNRSVEKIINYFPMWRDMDKNGNPMEEPLIDSMGRTNGRMGVQKGFSHNRIHDMYWRSQKPIQLGAMRIFMRAIEDQEHYIAFAQLSKDLNYIYGNVKEYVTAKFGDDFANNLQLWIDRIINPRSYNAIHKKQSFLDKLAGKITVAKLAANAVAIIKQLPSVTLFLPYTDPISMLDAMYRYIEDYKEQTEFAKSRSPDFRVRSMDDLIKENMDALADPNYFVGRLAKMRRASAQTNKVLMSPFSVFDGIACTIGWNAVYIHEMAKGSTEEKAIRQADKAYLKTQPQSEALYSPLIFDSKGWRLFLMFQRQANQIMQMIFFDIPNKIKNNDVDGWNKLKFTFMSAFVVAFNGLIMDWISRKFKPYGDEDDDDFFKEGWFGDMMRGTTSSMAQNIPIIGKPITAWIQGQRYTSSGFVDPATTIIKDVGDLTYSTIKKGELDADKVAKVITDAMGAAGLPEVATYRLYKASREDDLVDKMWTAVIGTPLGGKKPKKKTYFKKK